MSDTVADQPEARVSDTLEPTFEPLGARAVPCVVKGGGEIASLRCTEAQTSGCFCPQAYVALHGASDALEGLIKSAAHDPREKKRLADVGVAMVQLRARADGFKRKPGPQQFAGDALRVVNEQRARQARPAPRERALLSMAEIVVRTGMESKTASAPRPEVRAPVAPTAAPAAPPRVEEATAPAQASPSWDDFQKQKESARAELVDKEPAAPPPICDTPDCRTKLRVNNLSGKCQRCRNKVAGRNRKNLIPLIARAAGNAHNVLEADGVADTPAPAPKKRGPKPGSVVSRSMGKRCSVPGCARVLANKTKGDKCAPCLKGVKPGSGWEPCANAAACPRMAQRWKGELCALCRQGKKYHLVEKLKEKAMPEDKTPRTCAWPEEKCTVKILRLRASNKKGYCPKHNALVRQREARNINCASPRKKRGGLPKPAVVDLGANPPELEQPFPGMPAFADVPIAWARQFHDYLCKQGITFVTLSEDAAA